MPQQYPSSRLFWGLLIKAEHEEKGYPIAKGFLANLGIMVVIKVHYSK